MHKITLLFFLVWLAAVAPSWAWKFAVIADTRGFHADPQDPAEEWVNKRDPGVRTRVLSKISADIVAQGCALVIFPGDLIMGGPQSSGYYDVSNQYDKWRTAMAPVISAGIPIYPVRGNHEWYGDEDGDQWWNQFGQDLPQNGPADPESVTHTEKGFTYSFAYSNVFFVAMDEYINWKTHHDLDLSWLKQQLAANAKPHVFVYAHTPAFKVNGTTSDTMYAYPSTRDAFWKIMRDNNVRTYFCGHIHFYTRNEIKGYGKPLLYQVVTGHGGAAPSDSFSYDKCDKAHVIESDSYHSSHYGYNVVEINGNVVTVKYRKLSLSYTSFSDDAVDTFSYSVSPGGIPPLDFAPARSFDDYDGDHISDLALYDESAGNWVIRLSGSGYSQFIKTVGNMSSTAMPGDYDGDRLADPAVFNEDTAVWTILYSSAGYSAGNVSFGSAWDTPCAADYDGDGLTDLCLYTESAGTMSLLLSTAPSTPITVLFGSDGYHPMPSDYDGDGKIDPGLYSEATGIWQVLLSNSGYAPIAITFGGAGYMAVPADYDGDGKADPTVYSEAAGRWLTKLSSAGYLEIPVSFGGADSLPAVGDYDGDGKADPAVYSPSAGSWTVMLSSRGYAATTLP